MKKIHLEIVTPEKVIFDGEVDEILLPGPDGEIGVLPNHIPLVSLLKPGELKIKNEGRFDYYSVFGGFVEVRPDSKVVVLASAAEHAEDIDEAQALQAVERAKSLLRERKDEVMFAEASAALERALVRLKVVKRKRAPKKGLIKESF